MASVWLIAGLITATIGVSTLAAGFSVVGLGALFSGAALAVYAMAASLEFAKFVLAAYLHQRWARLPLLLKSYLLCSIVILSGVTSMGIFGFLSDAYQNSSHLLDSENIKLTSLQNQQNGYRAEIARLEKAIEEIPATRITKRLAARHEAEPAILDLNKKISDTDRWIQQSNLSILEVKKRVGPLIYIARAFSMDLDTTVKYLILVFVSVFDPLAICLVIATSEALNSRKRAEEESESATDSFPETEAEAEVVSMRFVDETKRNAV